MQQRWVRRGAGALAVAGLTLGALFSSGALSLIAQAQAKPTPTAAAAPAATGDDASPGRAVSAAKPTAAAPSAAAVPQTRTPGSAPGAGAAPAALEELAERLLAPPYPGPDGQVPTIQLLPGSVPPELPLKVSVPDGGRLIGTAVRSGLQKGGNVTIVLDAVGSPADVLRFYQQAFAGQGWTLAPTGPAGPRGFQPTVGFSSATFCQSASGPWLNLNVVGRSDAPTDVRLSLDTSSSGPCGQPPGPREKQMPAGWEKLPALTAPAGVPLTNVGGGGNAGNRWTSDATAQTDRGVAALEQHFAQQLEAAGWTRRDGSAQGPLAWSVWTLPGGGGWQGLLYALEGPGQGRRSLHVEVASATAQPAPYPVPAVPAARPPAAPAPIAPPAPKPTSARPLTPPPTATPAPARP